MARIQDLFTIHRGRGAYLTEVSPGSTPLISSTIENNGVLALVDIEPQFHAPAITVGRVAGKAFVQIEDFATVPDDMAVLKPRDPMSLKQLYLVAALINRAHWRFSYYRKLTPTRLGLLQIPLEDMPDDMTFAIPSPRGLVPPQQPSQPISLSPLYMRRIGLLQLFEIRRGNIHNASAYEPGHIPLISCSDWGNGILGYFDVKDTPLYHSAITVAYNGSPLTAKYHHYTFAAKDDVAVLLPKTSVTPETVMWVMACLNLQRWRYSYYRKCYQTKLVRVDIPVPIDDDGNISTEIIHAFIEKSSPYWTFVRSQWTT